MTRLLLILAASAALAPAAPVPRDAEPVLYFPTTVGAKWVYQYKGDDDESVEVVTKVKEMGGAVLVTVGSELRGEVIPRHVLAVSKDGLAVVAAGGIGDLTEPFWLLKLPHKDGAKWDTVVAAEVGKWRGKAVATGPEEVTVPAGKYRAIKVKLDTEAIADRRVVTTKWYAPDVGEVKEERDGRIRVLKKFTPGKP